MERIGVFCSSHSSLPENVVVSTQLLGVWLGHHEKTIVYGGGNKGLMEVLASAVRVNGGRVMSVVPNKMIQAGLASDQSNVEIPVVDLSDRKATMLREAELFIALPGGIGTLDEIFTVLASSLVGEHHKKVILFNMDGFWNPLLSMIRNFEQCGYVYPGITENLAVAKSLDQLIPLIDA